MSQDLKTRLSEKELAPTSPFWKELAQEYYNGPGYKERIKAHFKRQLAPVEADLNTSFAKIWKEKIIDPALQFLGIDYFYN